MAREFIEETIDALRSSLYTIETTWEKFQKGEITKEQFESKYTARLDNLKEDLEDEIYHPNNGCKYSLTNPDCEYFKKENV